MKSFVEAPRRQEILLNLLEVSVLNIVGTIVAAILCLLTTLSTSTLCALRTCLLTTLVHLLRSSLHHGVQVVDS
mgnify:CR=1 FL=1